MLEIWGAMALLASPGYAYAGVEESFTEY